MKIERISENQIRCTLSKRDLVERHLKISELAYGSEKARELFRDMMEQASIDFGFDADDIPLMIEAIPTSRDSIVLVITKVDNPEEFDEKFSRFGLQEDYEDDENYTELEDEEEKATSILDSSDIVNCFEQLHELIEEAEANEKKTDSPEFIPLSEALTKKKTKKNKTTKKKKPEDIHERIKVFSFVSLNPVIQAARRVNDSYTGKNSIWKDEEAKRYYLLMNRGNGKASFTAVCSIISEFGREESVTYATQDYFNEHYTIIIKDKAIAQLAQL